MTGATKESNSNEGWYSDGTSAFIMSKHSASGVFDSSERQGHSIPMQGSSKGEHAMIIHADPNT